MPWKGSPEVKSFFYSYIRVLFNTVSNLEAPDYMNKVKISPEMQKSMHITDI